MDDDKKKSLAENPDGDENIKSETSESADEPKPDVEPTRFGDWEKNGRCIDF